MATIAIPLIEEAGTGPIDELGTIGPVTFRRPAYPLPSNSFGVEIKAINGELMYLVQYEVLPDLEGSINAAE